MALGKAAPVQAERGLCKTCRSGKGKRGPGIQVVSCIPAAATVALYEVDPFISLSSGSTKGMSDFYWVLL